MLTYEDACSDVNLYAVWLTETYHPGELGELAAAFLRNTGHTVTEAMASALGRLPPIDLAEFIAGNVAFGTNDRRWLDHCEKIYPVASHPSETVAQRNGARTSWRHPT